MAQHILRIPELANAELKATVDVERIPSVTGSALPGFAELRPIRVIIELGGEVVYQWVREAGLTEDPSPAVSLTTLKPSPPTGGAVNHQRGR